MKSKSSMTVVGHTKSGEPSMAEMRKHAMERYKRDYGFVRGVRPASPDRDRYSYEAFKHGADLNDHFFGMRDRSEVAMMMGKPHKFAGSRSINDGHSCYGKFPASKKGHTIGKR